MGSDYSSGLNQCSVCTLRHDEGHEAQHQWDSTCRYVQDEYPRFPSFILRCCVGERSEKRRGQNKCAPKEGMVDALVLSVSKV